MPNHYDDGEYKGSEHATDVFKAPPKKETEGEKLQKSGEYLKDPETEVDTSQPLEASGMPPEIDPQKHKAQQKQKKIRTIAEEGSTEGERSAGQGKLKDQTQLPNFYQSKGTPLQKQDAAENKDFDQDVADAMEQKEGRALIDALLEAGRRSGRIATPQGQLEIVAQAAAIGGYALLHLTQITRGRLLY